MQINMALLLSIIILSVALADLTTGKAAKKHGYKVVCPENEKECYVSGEEEIDKNKIIEGDIIRDEEQSGESLGNALIDEERKWPNGRIPFAFQRGFATGDKRFIRKQMRFIENKTCIKFVPYHRKNPADTVLMLTHGEECSATVGYYRKKKRIVTLTRSCLVPGTVQHEMLHAIGLLHEQSRPDRDKYVTIIKENIEEGEENNFEKANPENYTTFNLPYDYNSVMHYSSTAFSKDGVSPTIVPKSDIDPNQLGQRASASKLDLKKVNLMYKCP